MSEERREDKRPYARACSCGVTTRGNGGSSAHRAMHARRRDGHYELTLAERDLRAQEAVPDGAQIVGIVDPPSPESLAVSALVLREADGRLVTSGTAGGSKVIHPAEYAAMLERGHVLGIEPVPTPGSGRRWALLCLGAKFYPKASGLGLDYALPPDVRPVRCVPGLDAVLWLGTSPTLFAALEWFCRYALHYVLLGGSGDAARLAARTMPDHELTRAALLSAAAGDPAREARELEWFCRIERDRGRPVSREDMEASLRKLIERERELAFSRREILGVHALCHTDAHPSDLHRYLAGVAAGRPNAPFGATPPKVGAT